MGMRWLIFVPLVALSATNLGVIRSTDSSAGSSESKGNVAKALVAVDGSITIRRALHDSTSKPSPNLVHKTSALIQIKVSPHGTRDMSAGGSLARSWSSAGFDMETGKDPIQDLSFCTLFDGREFSASFRNEIVLPHLLATSHAAENFVFFDCSDETKDELQRLSGMQVKHRFKLACVNKSAEARLEWSHLWMEEPDIALEQWPSIYTGTLRLALHQCFSACQTRFCAWADSDIMVFPTASMGWTAGARRCLVDAPKLQSLQHPPFFYSMEWYKRDSIDFHEIPLMRSWAHFSNAHFSEFSSQAFVVDKPALYKWLPIPTAALYYYKDRDMLEKIKRWDLPKLRSETLKSAIERLVVAKSTHESADCKEEGFTCSAVVTCDPQSATKVHLGDYKRDSLKRYGVNLSFALTEIDKDLTTLSRLTKLVVPSSEIDRQRIEVERLRKLASGVMDNMQRLTSLQQLKRSRRVAHRDMVNAKPAVALSEQVGAFEYMLMSLEERLEILTSVALGI